MSLTASIVARLGLDTSGFRSGLTSAAREVDQASGSMASGMGRATGAQENLLASNHRVARQIQNFSRDLASGADASQLFAGGLEGLERALRLPLGALAALGVGAVVFENLHKVDEAVHKLTEDIVKLGNDASGDAKFETLDALNARLVEIQKRSDEIEKSKGFSVLRLLANAIPLVGNLVKSNEDVAAEQGFQQAVASKAAFDTKLAIAAKTADQTDLIATRNDRGSFAADRLKAFQEFDERIGAARKSGNPDLEGEASRRLQITLTELDKREYGLRDAAELEIKIAGIRAAGVNVEERLAQLRIETAEKELQKATEITQQEQAQAKLAQEQVAYLEILRKQEQASRERAGGSLAEIAARPDRLDNSLSIQAFSEGQQAREVLRLRDQARIKRETIGGEAGISAAQGDLSLSDKTASGIASLKDSERGTADAVAAGLDRSRKIDQLIAAVEKNRANFSY